MHLYSTQAKFKQQIIDLMDLLPVQLRQLPGIMVRNAVQTYKRI